MNEYRAWDREEKLGPGPWLLDSKVSAWEAAHGHDVRLKCYPEFGCYLAWNRLEEAARVVVAQADLCATDDVVQALRDALDDL